METARCKAFMCAAETGSFSKAAEILNYTPSGVSQLVTAFENELGIPLLRRTKKGVIVTPNGELMLSAVRDYLQQENRIYQLASEMNGLVIGSVTIATYSSISTHWLPGVISAFSKDYPNIHIKLLEGVRQEVCRWLDEKTADVAFLSYKYPMPYDWFPIAEDRMLAVLPKNHPYAERSSYPLANCQNERLILPEYGNDNDVVALFEQYGLDPEVSLSTIESYSTLSMVEEGLGMSIMNELITKNWPCDVVKLPLDPPQSITLGIAVHSLKTASPAVKRFVKFAADKLREQTAAE